MKKQQKKLQKKNQNQTKLPNELKIFSKTYKIIYVDNLSDVCKDKQNLVYGQVDFDKHIIRIYLYKSRQLEEIFHTIFHEVIHIIKNNLTISFSEDDEEKIIDNIAIGIMHTCFENKFNFSK